MASRKRSARKELLEQIRRSPCNICGLVDPDVMEMHHLDEKKTRTDGTKRVSWSEMVTDRISRKQFLQELVKCITLCSNDHRRVHSGQIILPEVPRFTFDQLDARLTFLEEGFNAK